MQESHRRGLSRVSAVDLVGPVGSVRSGLYYRPVKPSAEESRPRHRIDEIYTRWSFFGSRRITAFLCPNISTRNSWLSTRSKEAFFDENGRLLLRPRKTEKNRIWLFYKPKAVWTATSRLPYTTIDINSPPSSVSGR